MTDVAPEMDQSDEAESWDGNGATYPEWHPNPFNHRYTVSFDGRGPMVVVRGNTAAEIISGFQELEEAAAGAAMGNAWASIKAAAAVASGLGATPVPPAAPAAPQGLPQAPTPPPFGPNVSVPQAPGYQGPPVPGMPMPPAPPQGAAQMGNRGPKSRPTDWPQVYKVDVPFAQKDAFKAFREQYKDQLRGKVQWAGGGNYWIHGDVASGFAAYNPVPA
ncbi:hypothetical protein ACWC1C_01435 [Streptomyces sp. NPDC001705]